MALTITTVSQFSNFMGLPATDVVVVALVSSSSSSSFCCLLTGFSGKVREDLLDVVGVAK